MDDYSRIGTACGCVCVLDFKNVGTAKIKIIVENILVIAYNRPDCVKQIIEILMSVKPNQLFVALDGPISDKKDKERCIAVRSLFESTKWNCDVAYLLGKENKGCNEHVEIAINWFFDNVEQGIILEDDCIPDPSFFLYASDLLLRYQSDDRVFMISGMSLTPTQESSYDYRFSKLVNIWGWATWRRAWGKMLGDLSQWPSLRAERVLACYGDEEKSQTALIDECFTGNRELSWGIKWRLTCLANNAYSIAPTRNLVRNVGFNRSDSHSKTFYHPIADIRASEVQLPLRHPEKMVADMTLDERGLRYYYEHEINNNKRI